MIGRNYNVITENKGRSINKEDEKRILIVRIFLHKVKNKERKSISR